MWNERIHRRSKQTVISVGTPGIVEQDTAIVENSRENEVKQKDVSSIKELEVQNSCEF